MRTPSKGHVRKAGCLEVRRGMPCGLRSEIVHVSSAYVWVTRLSARSIHQKSLLQACRAAHVFGCCWLALAISLIDAEE